MGGGKNSTPPSSAKAASSSQISKAIDSALRARGGKYAQYSCKTVSWDDASRSSSGGGLSCWGSNITDTYLKAKDGTRLFTVRPDNWNEKLGLVSTDDVALVTGNTEAASVASGLPLQPTTLSSVLGGIGRFGAYAGLDETTNLVKPELDRQVSIRFQTTFLPVKGSSSRGTFEFATEAYNYNTNSDANPRNLVLLCTTQGLAVQQDGQGAKKLFHHVVKGIGSSKAVSRHWLEAESSDHKVGGPQRETAAERADALARGKATASVIGTRSMGTRFNVLMTVQVPLAQEAAPRAPLFGFGGGGFTLGGGGGGFGGSAKGLDFSTKKSLGAGAMNWLDSFGELDEDGDCGGWGDGTDDDDDDLCEELCVAHSAPAAPCGAASFGAFASAPQSSASKPRMARGFAASSSSRAQAPGRARAARVSIGSKHDSWAGVAKRTGLARHPTERATVTVVLYHTVAGGVPSAEDVVAAVDDMEALYAACTGGSGRLADDVKFGALKNGGAPPPTSFSSSAAVANFSAFPSPVPQLLPPPKPFVPTPPSVGPSGVLLGSNSAGGPSEEAEALIASVGTEVSQRAFSWLHDQLALPWLAGGVAGGRLVDAYFAFLAANAVHVKLHGEPNAVAHYNLACCVAVACRDSPTAVLPQLLGNVASRQQDMLFGGSHYHKSMNEAERLEKGLQAALKWVRLAWVCGYTNTAHMSTDPDVSALRDRFGAQFYCS